MPWISEERLAEAREVDLLTYLQEREPQELARSARNEYRTKSHGSLVLSNGRWYWNRGQIGGRSALDYLIKVCGMDLAEAVEMIEMGGNARASPAVFPLPVEKPEPKALTLPPQVKYPTLLLSYMQSRGIRADIIQQCLDNGSLYEGRYNGEAVCVFVGRDDDGMARFACMRGINSDLKRDCFGSDKRFSFRIDPAERGCGLLA
jgi:hypothetical protein